MATLEKSEFVEIRLFVELLVNFSSFEARNVYFHKIRYHSVVMVFHQKNAEGVTLSACVGFAR